MTTSNFLTCQTRNEKFNSLEMNLSLLLSLLSHVWLFATPGTIACRAPLSSTISWRLFKFVSIELVMLSNNLIHCHPLLLPSLDPFRTVLPMNIQGWFPFGLAGLISLLSKILSRVFFSTTIQKHKIFISKPSFQYNCHICTWLLEKL